MSRNFLVFIFSGWMLVLFSGCNNPLSGEPSPNSVEVPNSSAIPQVDVYTVRSENVPLLCKLPGRTAAFNVAEVRPQVNGIVLKRKFEEGSFVVEGQELYEIDDDVYQAHFNKAAANLNNIERGWKRAEQLKENHALSEQEYEDALYALEKAKADLELARLDLNYCKIKAPLHGKIGRSTITVGALVTNGQTRELAVIQQIDPIYVDLNPAVPQMLQNQHVKNENENRLPFWQGAKVTLTLEDGTQYPISGKIKFLDNHVQEDTGTVLLRAEVPNPNSDLLPGMFVRATVNEGTRQNGKLIPQQSLFRDAKGNPYVWVVRADNTAEKQPVQVERMMGNTWLVDAGVEEGDRVIVEGSQFIEPNTKVLPQETKSIELKTSFD
ncbi:MAG: efflux RND transporter periplasmic adaptor subunit [Planctomycetaceae bacterium]|jgi:membrane fusion protein (multidrug efflux system)|nr:efflux RND transporter periplasmic adaptor subunit [Planctomycetaceae bacterium]